MGGYEKAAMDMATEINQFVTEDLFKQNPFLTAYLESYSAMDVHIMVRFGRWNEILKLSLPHDRNLMLFRTATLHFARALAYANLGAISSAKDEAKIYENIRNLPETQTRILHNNSVSDLLAVDSEMIQGEIAYFEGNHELAWIHLQRGVTLQDNLNYDEPWGKMQPIRHALGGLLLENDFIDDAERVFREDLKLHPKNPWALSGLIGCLKRHKSTDPTHEDSKCCTKSRQSIAKRDTYAVESEIMELERQFHLQRQSELADFNITHACVCCCASPKLYHG